MRRKIILLLTAMFIAGSAIADVYQEPEAFLREIFAGSPPAPKKLWIKNDLKQAVRDILDNDLGVLRLSYWRQADRTVWILEETGKEQPITTGIVINAGKIELIKVLIFRESRGWEVRHPFFTDQFKGLALAAHGHQLNEEIDGISGATLSVIALKNMARVALLFHQQVTETK